MINFDDMAANENDTDKELRVQELSDLIEHGPAE
jgi:hypothetical protein